MAADSELRHALGDAAGRRVRTRAGTRVSPDLDQIHIQVGAARAVYRRPRSDHRARLVPVPREVWQVSPAQVGGHVHSSFERRSQGSFRRVESARRIREQNTGHIRFLHGDDSRVRLAANDDSVQPHYAIDDCERHGRRGGKDHEPNWER